MAFDPENINVQLVDLVVAVVYDWFQHWWTTFKTITGKSIFTKKFSNDDAIVCKLSGSGTSSSMSVWIEFQDRDLFFKLERVAMFFLV